MLDREREGLLDKYLDLRECERRPLAPGKKLSILTQFYDDHGAIPHHVGTMRAWSPSMREQVVVQYADDCSPRPLLPEAFAELDPNNVRIVRIEDSVAWNQAGARNLNAYLACTPWCLFTDIDHVIDAEDLAKLLERLDSLEPRPHWFRRRDATGECLRHVNSYVIPRDVFLTHGGVDEDFAGSYGCEDTLFIHEMTREGRAPVLLDDVFLRVVKGSGARTARECENNRLKCRVKIKEPRFRSYLALRFRWTITRE